MEWTNLGVACKWWKKPVRPEDNPTDQIVRIATAASMCRWKTDENRSGKTDLVVVWLITPMNTRWCRWEHNCGATRWSRWNNTTVFGSACELWLLMAIVWPELLMMTDGDERTDEPLIWWMNRQTSDLMNEPMNFRFRRSISSGGDRATHQLLMMVTNLLLRSVLMNHGTKDKHYSKLVDQTTTTRTHPRL